MSSNSSQPTVSAPQLAAAAPPPSTKTVEGRLHSVALRTFIVIAAAVVVSGVAIGLAIGGFALAEFALISMIPTMVIIGVGGFLIGGTASWALLDELSPRCKTIPAPAQTAPPPSSQNSSAPPSQTSLFGQAPPPPQSSQSSSAPPSQTPPSGQASPPPSSQSSSAHSTPPGTPPSPASPPGRSGAVRPFRSGPNNCTFRAFLQGWESAKFPRLKKSADQLRQLSTKKIRDTYLTDPKMKTLLLADVVDFLVQQRHRHPGEHPEDHIGTYLASSTGDETVGLAHTYALSQLYQVKIIFSGHEEDLIPTPDNPQAIIVLNNGRDHTTLDKDNVVDISLPNINSILEKIFRLKKDSDHLNQMKTLLEKPEILAFEKYHPVAETPNPDIPAEKAVANLRYLRQLYNGLVKSQEFEDNFCKWRMDDGGVIHVADDGDCAFTAILKSYQLFNSSSSPDSNLRALTVQWMKDNLENSHSVQRMILYAMLGLYNAKIDKAESDIREAQQNLSAEEARRPITAENKVIEENSSIVDKIYVRLDLPDNALDIQGDEDLIQEYFKTIATPGVFASSAELEAMAQMLKVRLKVYDHNENLTNTFNAEAPVERTVSIITKEPPPGELPNHFNAYSPK